MNTSINAAPTQPLQWSRVDPGTPPRDVQFDINATKGIVLSSWVPWIFAAKTTAAGLLALLVAFAFNLDQPRWALITVFIVARPESGFVLAKSFYRIIGTLVGAAVALLLVSLFAQERVPFLGTLAIWIAVCTFASRRARNFAAYGFVLSGYTVAIVGIPGALDPGNAFFLAVARVTEISLGIMSIATINHLFLPQSLSRSLRHAVATGRLALADYAVGVLAGRNSTSLWTKLLSRIIAMENLRASAIFEGPEIRNRTGTLRRLGSAMLSVLVDAHLLDRSPSSLQGDAIAPYPHLDRARTEGATAIDLWRSGALDTSGLAQRLAQTSASLPHARRLFRDLQESKESIVQRAVIIVRLRDFFTAFVAFAEAYDAFLSPGPQSMRSAPFHVSNDSISALWAALRAAVALLSVGTFWILADWPTGYVAAILSAVATARLATMERPLVAATAGTLVIVVATVPAFVLVEMVLPDCASFAMFSLVVSPMLFICAFLMANPSPMASGAGFLAGLYFAYVSTFQDRMAYDAASFVNNSIAVILGIAVSAVLFAIIAPDTTQAACRRFARVAQDSFRRIAQQRPRLELAEFETRIAEALDQLCRTLRPDRRDDVGKVEAGIALMVVGRQLIRIRDDGWPIPAALQPADEIVRLLSSDHGQLADCPRHAPHDMTLSRLASLRSDQLAIADAVAVTRTTIADAAQEELGFGITLLLEDREKGVPRNAA